MCILQPKKSINFIFSCWSAAVDDVAAHTKMYKMGTDFDNNIMGGKLILNGTKESDNFARPFIRFKIQLSVVRSYPNPTNCNDPAKVFVYGSNMLCAYQNVFVYTTAVRCVYIYLCLIQFSYVVLFFMHFNFIHTYLCG